MKRKPLVTWFPFRFALLIAPLVAAWPPRAAMGQTLYWDNNSTTAGLGTHTGTWGTSTFWSTSSAGTAATANTATTNTHDLVFNGATGTVAVNAARIAKSLSFGASSVVRTISGGTSITLGGASGNSGIYVLSGNNSNTTVSTPLILSTGAVTFQNAGTGVLTINGGITGTQNLTLQNNGATANGVTVSTVALNNTGTVTSSGTGGGVTLISAPVGANVTTITQSSNTSALSVTGAITVATNKVFNSTGNAGFTISGGVTGTGNVTLNANGNGAMTASGTTLNYTGTLTNSGTGGGVTTVSAAIGASVSNITQSGANTQLILSGTNLYTGTTTASAGILSFTTNLAIPDYTTSPATAFGKLSAASGATLALPFGGATNGITNTDVANFLNGTYTTFAVGSSLGIDTTSAPATGANLTTAITNTLAGQLGFTKTGANALSISALNTYTGPTAIANGTLNATSLNNVTGGTASSSLGAPTTVGNGTIGLGFGTTTGTLNYTGPGETTDRVINLAGTTGGGGIFNNGAGTLTISSPLTFTGTGTKTLSVGGTGNITFGGVIAGGIAGSSVPLTITKSGVDTVTLSGANTATTLNLSGGTIDTGAGSLTLSNLGGATVVATGNATINGNLILSGVTTAGNGVDFGATTAGVTLTVNAVISGADTTDIDFWNQPTGTTILAGANTYQGQSNVSGQIVQVTSLNSVVGGTASSSLGAPTTAAKGTISFGNTTTAGTLRYTGTGETTDRVLNLQGSTGGGTVDHSGTGLLKFTSANTASGAGTKVLTLTGSTAGTGEIAGAIVNNSAANTTGITKTGTGRWTLSGVNTYTGPTAVNGGNLVLSQGGGSGVLDNTAITINSGGTLSPLNGFAVGTTSAGTLGAKLTLNPGGTLNLADGTVGNFTINQQASFVAANVGTFAGGTINFDLSDSAADLISFPGTVGTVLSSGANAISINPVSPSLTPGNYPLISSAAAGSTLSNANFYLASPNLRVGVTLYNLSLSGTSGSEVLTVGTGGPAVAPNSAFWNGTTTASWASQPGGAGTATNWSTSSNGTPDTFALPAGATNVTFMANSAGNLSTTLDQAFTINSLTYAGLPGAPGSSIASGTGTNALTINAAALSGNTAGNGINVQAGSGAHAISADVVLGASQTWTNSSTNPLTFTGNISGAGLTLTTAGTGTIQIGNGGTTGAIATDVALINNGVLAFNRSDTVTQGTHFASAISGTGSLTQSGFGTMVLSGTNTYTGNTTVNGGTLNLTGSITGNTTASTFAYGTTPGNTIINHSGSLTAFKTTGADIAGAVTVFNQTAGSVTIVPTNGQDVQWVARTGYGALNITGGTFNTGRFDVVAPAGTNGVGVMYVGGTGVLNQNVGDWVILTRTNGNGQLTVGPGGTVTRAAGVTAPFALTMDGTNSSATLNIAGGSVDTGAGRGLQVGFSTPGAGNTSWVNLASGTLAMGLNMIKQGTAGSTATFFNFAGGTVKSNAAMTEVITPSGLGHTITSTIFGPVTNNNNANAAFNTQIGTTSNFTGGLTVDTNGFATTFTNAFLAASGVGVTQANIGDVSLLAGNSGYIGAPAVTFSNPAAAGADPASGYAVIDPGTGKVTGIVMTNPGVYAASETPTITLSGGGGTIAPFATTALATNNTSGGLTKIGVGTLTLSGAGSTYSAGTTVSEGTLALGVNGGLPVNGNLTVNTTGTFDAAAFTNTVGTVSLQGSGVLTGSTGVITSNADYDLRSGSVSFTNALGGLAGAVNVTKSTAGTVTLANLGLGSFANAVNINGGTLAFSAATQLGNAAATNTPGLNGAGATLSYTGIAAEALGATRVVTIGAGGGTLNASQSTGVLTVTGGINPLSTGNLTKTGTGTVIIPGTSSWNSGANAVTVSDGTLRAGFGTGGISQLTVGATGVMDFANGAIETLTLGTGAGALTLANGARLGFELNGLTNDGLIIPAGGTASFTGGFTFDFTNFGAGVTNNTYTLISAPAASALNTFSYALGTAPNGFNYSFLTSATSVQLQATPYVPIYWKGLADSSWNTVNAGANFNWSDLTANGSNDAPAVPGSLKTVIFSATNAAAAGGLVTTTLDANFTLDGLQFISAPTTPATTSVTINQGTTGTLTLAPSSTSGGIVVAANGGNAIINAPVVASTPQTWNVDATGASLEIGGALTYTARVTKNGPGNLKLSNAGNTGAGGFTLAAGSLNLANDNVLGTGTFTIAPGTTIDATGAARTLNNGAYVWNGSFTDTGSQNLDLGAGTVALGASLTATVSANTLAVGGIIGDGGNNRTLTKAGAGTLTLSGNNTYGGGTTLNAGTLNLGHAGALGSGSLVIAGGSLDSASPGLVLSTNNVQAWNGDFTFTGTNSLNLGSGAVALSGTTRTATVSANTLTVGGGISGAGVALTKAGAGTLELTGNHTFTGALNVTAGSVILSGENSARPAAANNQTVVNGILQLQANAGNTSAGVSTALSGERTANQPFILNTGGTLQLRSDSAVTFAGANGFGGLGSATVAIDVNQLTGAGTNNAITLAPGGFNVSTTTINVSGGNGYSLRLPAITSVGANTSTYNGNSAPLSIGSYTANITGAHVLGLGGTNTGNLVTGTISNGSATTVGILKTGSGTWDVQGANTFTGPVTVREGLLRLTGAKTGNVGIITVGDTAATNATLEITNGTYTIGGASTRINVGNQVTTPGTGTVNQSGGAIVFTAAGGDQLLVGQNTFGNTGIYNLSGGSITTAASATRGVILGVNSNAAPGPTSGGGTFNLSGSGVLNMTAATGGGGNANFQIGRSDAVGNNTTNSFIQTGGTANVGILTMGGAATGGSTGISSALTLTGGTFSANSFTLLAAGGTNTAVINIGATAQVTLPVFPTARGAGSTATLTLDSTTGFLAPLAASPAYMPAGTFTNAYLTANGAKFDVGSGKDITIAQVLENAVSPAAAGTLGKTGAGILTLTGVNPYSGATTVTAGTLSVDGAGSINNSAVTVNGGTFRYNSSVDYTNTLTFTSGSVGGTNLNGSLGGLSIGAGQTLSPGNSPGTLTTTSQTWGTGGSYLWEINDAAGAAGTNWDLANGTGTLTVSATSGSPFSIQVSSLTLANAPGAAANFNDGTSYNWKLADFANPISLTPDQFAVSTAGFANPFTGTFAVARGDSGTIGGTSGQVFLTYTAVPEPSTTVLGGLALLALRRRRRSA